MQVEVDVKCMETNFGGCGLFGFEKFAPFYLHSKASFFSFICYSLLIFSSPSTLLLSQSNDNIGMPMIFTLTSAIQEKLQDFLQSSLEEEEKLLREKEEEEKRIEEEKYRGTIVTVESFATWRKAFMEEMNISKVVKDTSRLTGKREGEKKSLYNI